MNMIIHLWLFFAARDLFSGAYRMTSEWHDIKEGRNHNFNATELINLLFYLYLFPDDTIPENERVEVPGGRSRQSQLPSCRQPDSLNGWQKLVNTQRAHYYH